MTAAPAAPAVETRDLVKVFERGRRTIWQRLRREPDRRERFRAVDGIDLAVDAGEIFGLLGPNGAGKSTTVGVLTTRVKPTAGTAWIGNFNVWERRVDVKRLIGVVPQRPNLDFSLTAREILTFHGAYFGLPAAERNARADTLLDRFKLTDRAGQLLFGFSGGMMQRLSIARAMMHDPSVLFLDEPSAGLDPQTRLLLWEMVREYNTAGKTILLTTHTGRSSRRERRRRSSDRFREASSCGCTSPPRRRRWSARSAPCPA